MSTAKPDTSTLKKAAACSYMMGAWYFIAVIVLIFGILSMMTPYLEMMTDMGAGGMGTVDIDQVTQMLNAILLPIIVVVAITIPISIMFGYYSYKVGNIHGVGSLKLSGVSMMIVAIALVPLTFSVYILFQDLPNIIALPPTEAYDRLLGSMGLMVLGGGLAAVFGLIFLISFIIGLSGMKNATGINEFNTAMWLTIIGIFIGITFPIGIILFGSGLSRLARQGPGRRAGAPTVEEEARAPSRRQLVYCPYCGAKVESDALFCPTCGSSLRKEA